jgi:hypothetical protein
MVDRFGISGAGFPVLQKKHQPQHHGSVNMYGDVSDFGDIHTVAELPEAGLSILAASQPPAYLTTRFETRTPEATTQTDEEPGKHSTLMSEITQAEKSMDVNGIAVCKLLALGFLK